MARGEGGCSATLSPPQSRSTTAPPQAGEQNLTPCPPPLAGEVAAKLTEGGLAITATLYAPLERGASAPHSL
jgi:hypothetical protein